MRLFAIILSMFILFISVAPCGDSEEQKPLRAETALNDTGSAHDHSANDLCSPLCFCHCCHTHIVVHQLLIPHSDNFPVPFFNSSRIDPPADGFRGPILQPPQV